MCKLIENLLKQPEGKTLEFKQDLSSLKPIVKTIIAFANTAGGTIIIGVKDGGKTVGIDDPLEAEERLASVISDNIVPLLMPEIEITTIKNKTLLIIKVAHTVGPFYLKQFGMPAGVLVRLGSTNRQASPELIDEILRLRSKQSFDELPCLGATEKDFDTKLLPSIFDHFKYKPTLAKLKSLGLLVSHGKQIVPSNAGMILFANNEARWKHFADARVSCARFAGTEKVDFIDRLDIDGGILTAVEEVPKFIRRNTRMAAEIKDIKRRDISEYPTVAVREALLNALMHADYACRGSRILVAIFSDRLDITNPGMLPLGMTLEDLKNGVSSIRNKTISRVFAELEWVEQWGSGYKRIVQACEKDSYPIPKWEEFGSAVRITFYPHSETTAFSAKSVPYQYRIEEETMADQYRDRTKSGPSRDQVGTKSGLSRDQVGTKSGLSRDQVGTKSGLSRDQVDVGTKIVQFCQEPQSIADIMKLFKWQNRTKFKNKFIQPLMSKGLIKMTIPDKPQSSKQKYIASKIKAMKRKLS